MVTSEVPTRPIRLLSNIDCTNNCDGTTLGESYYTLVEVSVLKTCNMESR